MKITAIILLAMSLALLSPSPRTLGEGTAAARETRNITNYKSQTAAAHFEYVDVSIDPHDTPLAAYQFEFTVDPKVVAIVGVEGGEHAAFKAAPYYDLAALSHNRIIIAAFNTGTDLPKTKTRVARLHLRVTGEPNFNVVLMTSAGQDASKLNADISVEKGQTP